MLLIEIYKCLSDETRLRILRLLSEGPLCVCHFQTILSAPQVAISKHLAYLREHGLVDATRYGQWMIYRIKEPRAPELDVQLDALAKCVRAQPIIQEDLKRQKKVHCECDGLKRKSLPAGVPQQTRKRNEPTHEQRLPSLRPGQVCRPGWCNPGLAGDLK